MNADFTYNSAICDLCGSEEFSPLVHLKTGRAMRSDRKIIPVDLHKVTCCRCGLVRSGMSVEALDAYYSEEYGLAAELTDHIFYTTGGPVKRSAMLCEWLMEAMGEYRWRNARRCLEIGASDGALLGQFQERLPGTDFEGLELNEAAAQLARGRGLNVHSADLEHFPKQDYDIIYSVAVIEHVPSPTRFLQEIRRRLRPGGLLFLCQPTQDIVSYDVFFVDHIHHFGSSHLRGYVQKCGFRELGLVVGHEWMPNFSLHLWQAIDLPSDYVWESQPGETTCAATVNFMHQSMAQLDQQLTYLQGENHRVAAFGLNEVYWLTCAYSNLGDYPLVCGLDDAPDKPQYATLGFPVIRPEAASNLGVQDVILTMNQVYYPQASQRLEGLGLAAHPVFIP